MASDNENLIDGPVLLMTPSDLRRIAAEYGKQPLADALGWTIRTLDRKIAGQHRITKTDAIAVQHVVGCVASRKAVLSGQAIDRP